ncbi:hypothetical protein EXIGUO8H_370005 [Exiguobacterium sp. 8H]|uniref:hypothetical protein n=1 Tax=Exiguobacterium sp. 8A TaxID=2653139 RepID=UPI0012F34079|nr:hypothetical protein [Exiguobacterium sp. 8A]VXB83647.1 hypothetical protein EXIGUO8H_370005 [Exiguobacterium sp. 8H]VXB93017.1 hypothetical protein EXIGUO8A_260013 [Exiguobacterium sp. 8A]
MRFTLYAFSIIKILSLLIEPRSVGLILSGYANLTKKCPKKVEGEIQLLWGISEFGFFTHLGFRKGEMGVNSGDNYNYFLSQQVEIYG